MDGVGEFGTATLEADTHAIESASPGDAEYVGVVKQLAQLEKQRNGLAEQIKDELWGAEFGSRLGSGLHSDLFGGPSGSGGGLLRDAGPQTAQCQLIVDAADHLAIAG